MHAIRGSPRLSRSARQNLEGYLFALPWIIGFFAFALGPVVASLYLSFTDYNVFLAPHFIGIANYVQMFTSDALFGTAIYNTVYYTVLSMSLSIVLALALALLLNRPLPGIRLLRTAYYVPTVASGVALALVWVWLLDPQIGPVDIVIRSVGLAGPPWLLSPSWSKPALVLVSLWGIGNTVVIYLAALQGVPQELVDAAHIDGAGRFRSLWQITLPMISPTLFFTLVLGIIGSFQVFTLAYVATTGGPMESTLFYVLYLYRKGFNELHLGYASTLAWFLFAILVALTGLMFWTSRRWVYYEAEQGREP